MCGKRRLFYNVTYSSLASILRRNTYKSAEAVNSCVLPLTVLVCLRPRIQTRMVDITGLYTHRGQPGQTVKKSETGAFVEWLSELININTHFPLLFCFCSSILIYLFFFFLFLA